MALLLNLSRLDTELGDIIAISDEDGIYLLQFADKHGLDRDIERLRLKLKAEIVPSTSPLIAKELTDYFLGQLTTFTTPIHLIGSEFQKLVWRQLMCIPYGATHSYRSQAVSINKPLAYRAVANANGANQVAIMIPCHRIINNNGHLGGYSGGIKRKQWLLDHERKHA